MPKKLTIKENDKLEIPEEYEVVRHDIYEREWECEVRYILKRQQDGTYWEASYFSPTDGYDFDKVELKRVYPVVVERVKYTKYPERYESEN